MALLASWGKRFFDNNNSDWKKLIAYKYNMYAPNIRWSRHRVGSPLCKRVSSALQAAKNFYSWKIGNGNNISFWHDTWAGDCSLKVNIGSCSISTTSRNARCPRFGMG
uniref:Uncharacterized protein n=1 Tax=Hordeum vulgare subsp. vulgare TaxID=112509 RepID=A0A8I6W531_HORVV